MITKSYERQARFKAANLKGADKQQFMRTPNRIIICAKDIQMITGKCERTARRIIAKIRMNYNKPEHAFITLDEFCAYCGLKREDVLTVIN